MRTLASPDEFRAYRENTPGARLIHVLPAEVFAARRISGSHNACVYEVTFLSRIEAIAPDKDTAILLYGAGGGSLDAKVAAEKLAAAGYTQLAVFEGGLQAWEDAGTILEVQAELPAPPMLDGFFKVNVTDSIVRWTGRNLFNHHSGTLKAASGRLQFIQNRLVAGRLALDMNSIACEDITDSATNQMLIRHLRDADFFMVDQFPSADLVVRKATAIKPGTEGTPNWHVEADVTLRGVTRPLPFPAVLAAASSQRVTLQALLELDRTEFGSLYGSGRYYRFLGKHVVNDHIHVHVTLHADRES
jgi:polyisoprenoid-binding protein YceI